MFLKKHNLYIYIFVIIVKNKYFKNTLDVFWKQYFFLNLNIVFFLNWCTVSHSRLRRIYWIHLHKHTISRLGNIFYIHTYTQKIQPSSIRSRVKRRAWYTWQSSLTWHVYWRGSCLGNLKHQCLSPTQRRWSTTFLNLLYLIYLLLLYK